MVDVQEQIAKIPEWDEADYKQTSAPFDWLYQFRDNPFALTQLVGIMKDRAGALNVKNFMAMWKSYLSTKKSKNIIAMCNSTEFDGQPLSLMCGTYECRDECVTITDEYSDEIVVCTHPILPIQRMVNIDTDEVKLEIAYKRGKYWRKRIFDKTVLANSQQIIGLSKYGIAVDSDNARDLVKYISAIESMNYNEIVETKSVGRLGWIKNHGFSPYVEDLRFDGDISYQSMFNAVRQEGDYEVWLNTVREIRKGNITARIMLAASFASALVEPCAALPFFVHIWGGTEAGKTLGLMLAASVWANPAMGEYIGTFNATGVGLELTAGFCNSLPLCIDELQIAKSRKDFDETIYQLTEGIGRKRGAKQGGIQRTATWRNCIITTGEMPITNSTSGGGAVNRIIEIDCKDEKLFDNPRDLADTLRLNYGFAGREFAEALQDVAMDEAKRLYGEFSRKLSLGASTEKQIMAAALLLTADALADELIFQDGQALQVEDIEPCLTTKRDVDQNVRAYEWLLDFVAANPAKFIPTSFGDYSGECWGSMDEEYIYIIKSVFDAKMQAGGFNPTSFLSWARRRMYISPDAQGKNTRSKRINSAPVRCVWLKRNAEEETKTKSASLTIKETAPTQETFPEYLF